MQLQLTLMCTESNALLNYAIVGFNKISYTIPFGKIEVGKQSFIARICINTHKASEMKSHLDQQCTLVTFGLTKLTAALHMG